MSGLFSLSLFFLTWSCFVWECEQWGVRPARPSLLAENTLSEVNFFEFCFYEYVNETVLHGLFSKCHETFTCFRYFQFLQQ